LTAEDVFKEEEDEGIAHKFEEEEFKKMILLFLKINKN
jgi:hypothetical protein